MSIEGTGSTGIVSASTVTDCFTASLCALNGGRLVVNGGDFARCNGPQGQGLCCQGSGSHVAITGAKIHHCKGTCIVSLSGGIVEAKSLEIFESSEMQGVACARG